MKSIMLATDFSERSDRALRRATLLARTSGATLCIVHVVDDDHPRRIVDAETDLATSLLRELKATVTNVDEVECTMDVIVAAPHSGIAQAVAQTRPDLLVIGSHRRQVLRDIFVGTTAERIIHSVDCPVLMVNAPPVGPYDHALLTTDFSEGARYATRAFGALGMGPRTRVAMLHVFEVPEMQLALSHMMDWEEKALMVEEQRAVAAQDLSVFAKTAGKVATEQLLRHAQHRAAVEILSAAETEHADLIVVGTTGKSGLLKFFLGSVAEEVLRGAACDVLAVPHKNVARPRP